MNWFKNWYFCNIKKRIMSNSTPLVVIEKVEINHINHVDIGEIIRKLDRIHRAVERDTAAEEALAKENENLHNQLEELLSGETLPPEVQAKVDAIFAQAKLNKEKLSKGIADNQPKTSL